MLSLSADKEAIPGKRMRVRALVRWLRWRLPARLTSHRILSGALKGKYIVTSWRDYPAAIAGITEPNLLGWFSNNVKPGQTWLDIGAHYGYTSIALAGLVGEKGRIFAFEPMASTVGALARTRYLNRLQCLTIMPMALGCVEDVKLLELATVRGMVDSTVSGAVQRNREQWNEMFMVGRLDWLWPRICAHDVTIHGLKIDVQGMELHVLRGMREILRAQRPRLVLELHRGVDRNDVLAVLSDVGYSINATPIEPVPGEVEAQFLDDRSYAFCATV